MRTSTDTGIPTDRDLFLQLNGTEQFHLQVQRYLAHLIEEHGAAIGSLEESFLVHRGAAKRSPLVSESRFRRGSRR